MEKVFPPAPGQRHPSLPTHSLARRAVNTPFTGVHNRSTSPQKCPGLESRDSLGKCSTELLPRIRYTPEPRLVERDGFLVLDLGSVNAPVGDGRGERVDDLVKYALRKPE